MWKKLVGDKKKADAPSVPKEYKNIWEEIL